MEKEKLILSENNDKFYLSVPSEIEIGKYDCNEQYINAKYTKLFSDKMFVVTKDINEYCLFNFDGKVNLFLFNGSKYIIPKGAFELGVTVFSRLRSCLEKYKNIFEIEFREFYSDNKDDFENYKVNIDYEMIKLENPVKNKDYLFRLKDNNIPMSWVERSSNLIKKRENLNSRYGNISCEKVNLVDFNGRIPENIDFIITQSFAKRLDDLFKCWNNGYKKTKKMKLVDFLYEKYSNRISVNDNYYTINLNDKFSLLVDVQYLQILEVKTNYYNLKISYIDELNRNIVKIRQKIDELNN
jgi:hypothetical protein